jgi:hypothetical protein
MVWDKILEWAIFLERLGVFDACNKNPLLYLPKGKKIIPNLNQNIEISSL